MVIRRKSECQQSGMNKDGNSAGLERRVHGGKHEKRTPKSQSAQSFLMKLWPWLLIVTGREMSANCKSGWMDRKSRSLPSLLLYSTFTTNNASYGRKYW
jgi:hypothetical protein